MLFPKPTPAPTENSYKSYSMSNVIEHIRNGEILRAYATMWFVLDGKIPFEDCVLYVDAMNVGITVIPTSILNVPIKKDWTAFMGFLETKQKIRAIRELRDCTGYGIGDAKDIVESLGF
jgi:hypothetical protein